MRLLVVFLLFLGACAGRPNFVRTELYFGMNIPRGGEIKDSDFQLFVDTCISPRFSEGLTILEGRGQWRDTTSGRVDKEGSRVVVLVYPRAERRARGALVEQVRASYMRAFEQQAVMRVDVGARVRF